MTDLAPPRAASGAVPRVAALFVVAAAVVVGAWQAGRIMGPLDTGSPLPGHVSVHEPVVP